MNDNDRLAFDFRTIAYQSTILVVITLNIFCVHQHVR